MKKIQRILAIALAIVLAVGYSVAVAADWNHDPDSIIGPFKWSTLDPQFSACGGLRQSPIDISEAVRGRGQLPGQLTFRYDNTPLVVENNGHAIEVPYAPGKGFLYIDGKHYQLAQFHFHAPSEHKLNGASYDMEMHLVHKSSSGEIAVAGVWLKACQALDPRCKPNRVVDLIFKEGNVPVDEGKIDVPGTFINAKSLLPLFGKSSLPIQAKAPVFIQDYFNYSGSLTTPPCSEGVRWFMLKNPITVSQATVDKLHEIIREFPAYKPPVNLCIDVNSPDSDPIPCTYENNNRPTQPLNGRKVTESIGR